jgi:hypothetical protein
MDDRDYRPLEKIVKTEKRAPLVEITDKFNEERNVSVSKRTLRWRLRDHGFSRRVCKKKVVIKLDNRKKTDWHGVGGKGGGQISTNGVKIYWVTSHKFVLGRNDGAYVWRKRGEGWRPDFVKERTDRKFSIMMWGWICYNGEGGREYKCWQIHQHSGGQYLTGYLTLSRKWLLIPGWQRTRT